jgi:hypothetical protein
MWRPALHIGYSTTSSTSLDMIGHFCERKTERHKFVLLRIRVLARSSFKQNHKMINLNLIPFTRDSKWGLYHTEAHPKVWIFHCCIISPLVLCACKSHKQVTFNSTSRRYSHQIQVCLCSQRKKKVVWIVQHKKILSVHGLQKHMSFMWSLNS